MRANEATKSVFAYTGGGQHHPLSRWGPQMYASTDFVHTCMLAACAHRQIAHRAFFSRSRYSAISVSLYTCNTANCHLRACIPSTQHCFGRFRFLFGFQHCREGVRALSGAGMGLSENPELIATHNALCVSSWRGHMPPVGSSYSQQSSHRRVSGRSRSRACLSTSWRL